MIQHERLPNAHALGVFASDALSSMAYATEEILMAFVVISSHALGLIPFGIALCIVVLMSIVAFSYQHVVHAYPQGGGGYNVTRDNFISRNVSLAAAAALTIDYILTVSVSVSAGVFAITSAMKSLMPYKVEMGLLIIAILVWGNLRGIRESGRNFCIPAYAFLAVFGMMFLYALSRVFAGTFPGAVPPTPIESSPGEFVGVLLLLKAFSSGCAALTGIEAISNGVQSFRPPEGKNAALTLKRMVFIMAIMFLGITFFAYQGNFRPTGEESLISQITWALFAETPFGIMYYVVQGVTAAILIFAANTPFAGFPPLMSQVAADGYLPRQFMNRGSKGVHTAGILFLAVTSGAVLVAFQASTHALIPLYAVGVFICFTLTQWGMVRYHRRQDYHGHGAQINTIGACATAVVLGVVFLSKFSHGAWVLLPLFGILMLGMKATKKHYENMEEALRTENYESITAECGQCTKAIVLVSGINTPVLQAIAIAKRMIGAVEAFHVAFDPDQEAIFREEWEKFQAKGMIPQDVTLHVAVSEYRNITAEVLGYLKNTERNAHAPRLIVMPQIIPPRFWQHLLHNQTAKGLEVAIENDHDINDVYILDVPYKVHRRRSEFREQCLDWMISRLLAMKQSED